MRSGADLAVIWVDRWQMTCCGTPFALSDTVSWSIRTDVDRTFLSAAATREVAAGIAYREEHHEPPSETALDLARDATGIVRGIRALRCRYGWDEVEGASVPIAGSGILQTVGRSSDDLGTGAGRRHLGWIVELEVRDLG